MRPSSTRVARNTKYVGQTLCKPRFLHIVPSIHIQVREQQVENSNGGIFYIFGFERRLYVRDPSRENAQRGVIPIFRSTGTCEVRISRFRGDLGDV